MISNLEIILKAADFAAVKHKNQRRKGSEGDPYINHPISVARLLIEVGGVEDIEILTAAILHDTVEDTDTTEIEIIELFGQPAASLVMEVTDDKGLEKEERKRLQIAHAPHLSAGAKLVKLADKISNIEDVISNPPEDWDCQRRVEYVQWGKDVVAGLRGCSPALEQYFDELCERADEVFS